jgi:hypothetical protein
MTQAETATTRTAECACGRVKITVEGEPLLISLCHCGFCQKRSGSVLSVSAMFLPEQVVAIDGEMKRYNAKVSGEGADGMPEGVNYYFCTTCGSTLYNEFFWPFTGEQRVGVTVGNFEDPEFPAPTNEFNTQQRHHWVVSPVPPEREGETLDPTP